LPRSGSTRDTLKDFSSADRAHRHHAACLRHSFASIANNPSFTEATIAVLAGHSRETLTSRYIHTVDTALIIAADRIAGYRQELLDGVAFSHTSYALDRDSGKSALAHVLGQTNSSRADHAGA
jgi:hypothetical protein